MNQILLGLIRSLGYPMLFAALAALASAIPGVQGLPVWLPAGVLTAAIGMIEHQLSISLGYNVASTS